MVFFCSYLKCLEAEEQVKRNEFIARRFEQDVCQGILPSSGFHHQSTKPRATIMALDKTSSATCELFLIKTIEMFSRS